MIHTRQATQKFILAQDNLVVYRAIAIFLDVSFDKQAASQISEQIEYHPFS